MAENVLRGMICAAEAATWGAGYVTTKIIDKIHGPKIFDSKYELKEMKERCKSRAKEAASEFGWTK